MKTTTSGRAFAKSIFDLFSTLMISLPIETHKVLFKSYPNSFTAEEAIANLGGLQFIQANREADPNDPTRIISHVVTTQFSLQRDMAKNLCQTFMDARLFECATDVNKREFQNKGIYQVTGKGAHIVEKFVHRNALSVEATRHITSNATPRILFLERAEDEDAIVLRQKAVDAIFKRFAGLRPNVGVKDSAGGDSPLLGSASSPGRDRGGGMVSLAAMMVDRCNGIEVKDQQHNYDVYKHTFYGKAAVEWLLDYTTVISKEEAICIAQEMVNARYIEQVGEENRASQLLFKTGNYALYHFTEAGRAVLGWESLVRSRGSSVNNDWMEERGAIGAKMDRSNSELKALSAQFKATSNTIPRLPISVAREKRRSMDESSLNGSQYGDESSSGSIHGMSNLQSSSRRLSQILKDLALSDSGGNMSNYAPSSSGRESVGRDQQSNQQQYGQYRDGMSVGSMASSAMMSSVSNSTAGSSSGQQQQQPTTSNTTRLNLILSDTTLREMFKSFLKQNICEENLAFHLEVQDYKGKFNALINSTRAYTQSLAGNGGDPVGAAGGGSGGVLVNPGGSRGQLALPPQSTVAGAPGAGAVPHPSTLRELEKQICTQAFAIYETFLVSGSPREVNLPHQMRQDITAYMQAVVRNMDSPAPAEELNVNKALPNSPGSPSGTGGGGGGAGLQEAESFPLRQKELIHISLFDRIHDHICRLMSEDSVPKFIKTDKYLREVMMNRTSGSSGGSAGGGGGGAGATSLASLSGGSGRQQLSASVASLNGGSGSGTGGRSPSMTARIERVA